jgi:ribulose-5-phosphate 4-epimerase/fuculose-1-phosphate aldolase
MRTCMVCGKDSTETTVVVDHRDAYVVNGELYPSRDLPICLADYKAKTGKDYEGAIPED